MGAVRLYLCKTGCHSSGWSERLTEDMRWGTKGARDHTAGNVSDPDNTSFF